MHSHDDSEWEDFDALLEAVLPSQSHNKEFHEQTNAELAAELEAALSSAQEDETSSLTEEELEFAKELEDALNEDDTINDTRVISHKSSGHIQTPIRDTSGGKKGNGKGNDHTAATSPKTQTSSAATANVVVVGSQRASPRGSPSKSNLSPRPGTKATTTTTTTTKIKKKSLDTTKKGPAHNTPTRKHGSSKEASSAAHQVTAPEQPTIIERTSRAAAAGAVNVKPLLALSGTVPAFPVDRNEAPRAIRPLPRPHIGRTTKSDAKASASGSTSLEQLHATESDSVHAPPSYRPARSKNAPKSSAGRKRRSRAAPRPPPELPPQKDTTSDGTPTMTPLPDWMLDSSKPWGTGLPKGPYRVRVEAPARSASAPQLEAAQGSRPVVRDRHHSAPVPSTSNKRAREDEEEGEWEDIGDDCMMLVPKRAKLADFEPRTDAQPGASSTVPHAHSYPSFPTAPDHPSYATPAAPEGLTAGGQVARTFVRNAAASLSGGMQHPPARQPLPVQHNHLYGRATHTGMHPYAPPTAVPALQFTTPRYILGQESSTRAPGPNVIPYGQALQDTRVAQLPFNTTAPRNATPMPGPVEGLPRPILRHPAPNAQRQRLSEAIEQLRNPYQQSDERSHMPILAPLGSEQLLGRASASAPAIPDPSAQYGAYAARQEHRNPWTSMQMLPGNAETWQGPGRAAQMQMEDSAMRFPPPQLHETDASYEENMRPSVMTHFHAAMPVPMETRNGDQGIAVRAQPRTYAPPQYPPPGWNPHTSRVGGPIGGSVSASELYPYNYGQ